MFLLLAVAAMGFCTACSEQNQPPDPQAKFLRDFLDVRLDNILSALEPGMGNGNRDQLKALLGKLPKSQPELPHLILVLNENETVLAARTFQGPNSSLDLQHPVGYNYSKYEMINGKTAEKGTFLFCMYSNEGKLMVACRSSWAGVSYKGTACVALPCWCLPEDERISEQQFINLRFDDK